MRPRRDQEPARREGGIILIFSVIAILLIAGLSTAFLSLSLSSGRAATAQVTNSSAFYVAEAALDEAVLRITHLFNRTAWDPGDMNSRFTELDAIDTPGDGAETVFRDRETGAIFQRFPLGPGLATVWVQSDAATIRDDAGKAIGLARDLQLYSSGTVEGVTCSVQRNMRYQIGSTRRFQYALLARDLPECMFCHLEVHGDAGQLSSGEFRLWSPFDRFGFERSAIHGNLYLKGSFASASRDTNGASSGLKQERLVTDQGGRIHQSFTGERLAEWSPIRPSFEPNAWYESLSRSEDSSITFQNPPHGDLEKALDEKRHFMAVVRRGDSLSLETHATPRVGPVVEGHLVVFGTPQHPIRIDKSVTVHGDVVIKGTVTGVGNINASGNIFIVDSIRYQNPPQNLQNAEAGALGGAPADKLGLSSASNILIGDLTHPRTASFIRAQFVDVRGSGYSWVPAEYLNNRYALDGKRDLAARTAGGGAVDTPGLLPEGAAAGLYSPLTGLTYARGWMAWSILDRVSNHSLNRIDATLFADHAIAGGQPAAPSLLTMAGGVVGGDIGVLSARGNSASAFTIYYDNRNRNGNPMGFPLESAVFETGWFRIPPRT